MALDSTHYVTLQDLRSRVTINDSMDDVTLEPAIKAAARGLDVWCGQSFYKLETATARTFVPTTDCQVKTDPFWTTNGLVVASDTANTGTYSTTITSYTLERFGDDLAHVLLPGGTPYDTIETSSAAVFLLRTPRRRSVQITAQWGWETVPDAVTEATKILAYDLWKRKDTPFGIATGSIDFGPLRIGRDTFAQVASLLTAFRRYDRVLGFA